MSTRVKVCGITRAEDAEAAVEHGAWALGFILWEGSKRACDPAVAAGISRGLGRSKVERAGVFVNAGLDEIAHLAVGIGLTLVQLHGDEGPSFCTAVRERTGCKVIKAIPIATQADLVGAGRFRSADFHLLDTAKAGQRGGTGETWEWSLAGRVRSVVPRILSGGLTPDNVADGIAAVRPFAVDVASGVEAAPGVKDHEALRAFLAAANPAPDAAPAAP